MEYSSLKRYIFKFDLKKESGTVDIMDLWKGRSSKTVDWLKALAPMVVEQAGGPLRAGEQRLKIGVSDCSC